MARTSWHVARGPSARWPIVTTAALAAVATAILTRRGVLLDPDSATYLRTAAWIRDGWSTALDPPSGTSMSIRGLFPPGYPVLLAILGADADHLGAVRLTGIACAALVVGLATRLVARATSALTGLVVGLLIVAGRGHLLVLFGFAMAEGPYLAAILLALTGVAALWVPGSPRRALAWAMAAGLAAGAAMAIRLVGLGAVAAVPALVATTASGDRRARRRLGGVALAAGLLPNLAIRVALDTSGSTGRRHLGLQPLQQADLWLGDAWVKTFVPEPAIDALGPGPVHVIGIVLVLAAAVWSVGRLRAMWREGSSVAERTTGAFVLVAWAHEATLLGARLLFDRLIPLDGRHAMPWTVALLCGAAVDVHRRLEGRPASARTTRARRTVGAVAAVALVGGLVVLGRSAADPGASWHHLGRVRPSSLAAAIDAPADATIYTNREDLVWLDTGRPTARLPSPVLTYSDQTDPDFPAELADLAAAARDRGALVVVYTGADLGSLTVDDLIDATGLRAVRTDPEGVILAG